MSEVSLSKLRGLRERAQTLLRYLIDDLRPFVKEEDGTFLRKPDSRSVKDDVNVTTTCSCLMALALTRSFQEFYRQPKLKVNEAEAVFRTMVDAPWMSSGLTANNAFSTTLVLRAFGFLSEVGLFDKKGRPSDFLQKEAIKKWELDLGILKPFSLAKKLKEHTDAASKFLWFGLTDNTRDDLSKQSFEVEPTQSDPRLRATLALELRRIIQSGWIYEPARFDKASTDTKNRLDEKPTGYKLAEVNHELIVDQYADEFAKPVKISLQEIAAQMATRADHFSINEYPPSAAVAYWFVDGVERAQITLEEGEWASLCSWATKEFNHERSLVVAEHDAMMDPVAMGMSACLCARLRNISDEARLGMKDTHLTALPSLVELERSIGELISKQTTRGIFHKYFPMFHYQEAGSNFCFTFELLEAVLYEFGRRDNKLLEFPMFISGLEKAVSWCESNSNRLKYSYKGKEYTGWNSGGDLKTLRKGQPESWATAVVYMFLWELETRLSELIQHTILRKYKASAPARSAKSHAALAKEPSALDKLWEIEVLIKGEPQNLSDILKPQIIEKHRFRTEASLRIEPMEKPRSALLFGPPGTSKTNITKAIATDLNWPLLEITPSHFVKGSLANVYLQADEIFEDLMDLSGVVVFFDEMDALVQTRDTDIHLDIASQFLTTTMLPKLALLHDQGRVGFFMATNFQDRFDPAIKRSGRFDLLLCMGPPKLSEKLDRLHTIYRLKSATSQTRKAGAVIRRYLEKQPKLEDQLGLYTFGEFESFLKRIGNEEDIGDKLEEHDAAGFRKLLRDDSRYVILKMTDLNSLREIKIKWKRLSDLDKKKFTLKQLEQKKIQPTQIIRYFIDRRESREQY